MKSYLVLLFLAVGSTIRINKYDGPLPEQYDLAKGGDAFMNKVLRAYGEPVEASNGQKFVVSRESALAIATDIMENNQGMKPNAAKAHIGAEFDKAWTYTPH